MKKFVMSYKQVNDELTTSARTRGEIGDYKQALLVYITESNKNYDRPIII